ncbi:MAG TPA: hypothetical protein QGF58_27555 [Myxococcota bacterium]|nr:hypothetical protein [Myxococcota bacterium]
MLSLLVLLATTPALAGDPPPAGTSNPFGLGVSLGYPHNLNGKYWMNKKAGVGFYAGGGLLYGLSGHVAYEQLFWQIGDWDWARLNMYWNVGVIGGLRWSGALLGAGGGVGATMRFKTVPAEAFIHHNSYITPTLFSSNTYYGHNTFVGARWYF